MAVQLREDDIQNAMMARLGNAIPAGITVRWPNRSGPPTRPYYEITFPDSVRSGGALGGAAEIEIVDGVLSAIVVVNNDEYTAMANDWAAKLVALYPEGTKINITNGQITVRLPSIGTGFEANGQWRVPIRIPYEVTRV